LASQINASNSGFGGIVSTGDSSGVLQLQTANTTAVTIDTSQNVNIGQTSTPAGWGVQAKVSVKQSSASGGADRKSTRLNSSHVSESRMPSSA